jgi:hypothetical protein
MLMPHQLTEDILLKMGRVLACAAGYDKRTLGKSDVRSWALALGGYPEDDLTMTIVEFYLTHPTDDRTGHSPFITVGDVAKLIKATRADRAAHDVAGTLEIANDSTLPGAPEAFIAETKRRRAAAADRFMAELHDRIQAAPQLRAVPQAALGSGQPPTPKYTGKPGQARFKRDPHPAVEAENTREALLKARTRRRAEPPPEDRKLVVAKAMLALVENPADWLKQAAAELGGEPDDRDVKLKAADLIRADEIARREAS